MVAIVLAPGHPLLQCPASWLHSAPATHGAQDPAGLPNTAPAGAGCPASLLNTAPASAQGPASLLTTTVLAKPSCRFHAGSVKAWKKQPARFGWAKSWRPAKRAEQFDRATISAFQHHWHAMNRFLQQHVVRIKDHRRPAILRLGLDPSRMLAEGVFGDVQEAILHLEALRTIASKRRAVWPC